MKTGYARAAVLALICVARSTAGAGEPVGWPQFLGPTGDLHARGLEDTADPPALVTLAGETQVVSVTDTLLRGLSLESGDVLRPQTSDLRPWTTDPNPTSEGGQHFWPGLLLA